MNRQQVRRIAFKAEKAQRARDVRQEAAAELAHLRATRRPHQLPKRAAGKLLSLGRPYAKKRGEMNRSILRDVTEIVPAITAKVGRKTITLVPERAYDAMFHATKGPRRRRVVA